MDGCVDIVNGGDSENRKIFGRLVGNPGGADRLGSNDGGL